ncbi:unnamed protein product [Cuscuta campestris]|uniref:ubiquitinyl hydrolase 1 n=1 Tax=Cuscuta campestris TaxID=132261 RepID=A0A484MFA9_9ASTE|nr:unnamed protein product [Cuscuta campestris]
MLVGGDLGFLSRAFVAAFLVLAGPLLAFVVRWKWRRAVARREEVDRLLVFASDEAARAESQAAAEYGFGYGGYSFGSVLEGEVPAAVPTPSPAPVYSTSSSMPATRQQPYQCANCFSPASTRCSRCKAVRYCSGKCQIVHWRLGHKDECQPPSNSNHGSNGEEANHSKVLKQGESEGYAGGIQAEEDNSPVSIAPSSPEIAHSKARISTSLNTDNARKGKHFTDGRSTNSDSDSSSFAFSTPTAFESSSSTSTSDSNWSDGIVNSTVAGFDHIETSQTTSDHLRPHFLEQPTVVSSTNSVSTSSASGLVNISNNGCTKSNPLSSIPSIIDGFGKSSLLDPSVPSSDFWEGIARYSRSKVNTMEDDGAHPDSEDVITSNNSDSQLFPNCSTKMARTSPVSSASEQNSKVKSSSLDCPRTEISVGRKANEGAQLSQVKDDVDMQSSSSLRVKSRNTMDLSHSTEKTIFTDSHSCPVENDTLKIKSAQKMSHNTHTIDLLKNASYTSKSRQVEHLPAKPPLVYPSSSIQRHDYQGVKSIKTDSAQVTVCLSGPGGDSQSSKVGQKSNILKGVDPFKVSKLSQHNSLRDCGENVGRYNNKGLFPYELFVRLFNSNKVELHPFGLKNCGNSCYANAVLQCLAFTPPFTAYFLQGFHSKGCAKKEWCFTCEFETLVLKAKDGNSPLSPISIISHLEDIGSSLGNGREEDAHEFLRYVIETMQSICLKEAGVRAPNTSEEKTCLVDLTFGGFIRSKIQCLRCGGKSEKHERMMDLTIEIDGDIGTLEGALKQFTHTEVLDGENKYHCSRCKSYEKARKKLKILEAPNVLTIVLKRFQTGRFGKLNKMITFPEILNLASYMSGTSDKSPIYRLYGVIVHLDVMNAAFSGHYVCYVKNYQNKWFEVDDSTVKPVELECVLTKGAYMLLYSRCSPRAPRLIRSSDPRAPKHFNCKSSSHKNSWDFSSSSQGCGECFNSSAQTGPWTYHHHHHQRTMLEDSSSSDNSSSLFSEGGSFSTDSSHRDSIDDFADQFFGDHPEGVWRNSPDSDTSSSSSSSPFSRHSPLADMDRYTTSSFNQQKNTEMASKSKGSVPYHSVSDSTAKHCRSLGGSRGSKLGSDKAHGNMRCR